VHPWADRPDVEDYRQAALEGIEEYMGLVGEMPEPLRVEMRRYLGQFRDRLGGFDQLGPVRLLASLIRHDTVV